MTTYAVIRKSDQVEVTRYSAMQPTVFDGYTFDLYDHNEFDPGAPPVPPIRPENWYIGVGPFYDRFGAYKLAILSSTDPMVQAVIKDSSVRKYLDLKGRRAELAQVVGLLQSKGFAVTEAALLDVQPTAQEVYRG
jgi:hypothetical protein